EWLRVRPDLRRRGRDADQRGAVAGGEGRDQPPRPGVPYLGEVGEAGVAAADLTHDRRGVAVRATPPRVGPPKPAIPRNLVNRVFRTKGVLMARWRTLVAAAGAVLALALTSGAGYRPETSLPRWQSAAGAVELSVTLVGGDDEIVVGRSVTYAIEARNSGRRPVTTSLRASVPARMYEVVPADGGRLAQGVVEWPEVAIPAGRTVTLHVTGAYGPADSDEPR